MMPASIYWFRKDLRLADNPALLTALSTGAPIIPVYIWAPEEEEQWKLGGAAQWWLHHSLISLQAQLKQKGSRLIIKTGSVLKQLQLLIEETDADTVTWNRCYEPHLIKQGHNIKQTLEQSGVQVKTHNSSLLYEPWDISTQQGKPFQVFSAFWKNCLQSEIPRPPFHAPKKIPAPQCWPVSNSIESLDLKPTLNWADSFSDHWIPGEDTAQKRLKKFVKTDLADYATRRDLPFVTGTSALSPHLNFGEISPHQIYDSIAKKLSKADNEEVSDNVFLTEIGWREFAHHTLYHFPHTSSRPFQTKYSPFEYNHDDESLRKWQTGKTGFPIVDAGMRELWATGWMHNRVRMIVASFLTKDMLISWNAGAKWFWDTLLDANLANNTMGWQWIAGSGASASPFFRIFNPLLQSKKFDPQAEYIRRWVPELSSLPSKWRHEPWQAPQAVLDKAGIVLGEDYPFPILDHKAARQEALARYQRL